VHLVLSSLGFLAKAQPRLETGEGTKGTFWQTFTLDFLGDRTNIIGKITNLFCII
jgi:hypothetical protein